jgi:hypothetical protein
VFEEAFGQQDCYAQPSEEVGISIQAKRISFLPSKCSDGHSESFDIILPAVVYVVQALSHGNFMF